MVGRFIPLFGSLAIQLVYYFSIVFGDRSGQAEIVGSA
jgi:hypothetical protein